MATDARIQEILSLLRQAVVDMDEETTVSLVRAGLEEGLDAEAMMIEGLAAGMVTVGHLYEQQQYFVPEVLLCSDALYAGMELLRPRIQHSQHGKGKIIIGTVEGDIHDIGKNLVKLMLEAEGFEVIDLGADVKLDRFVEEQLRTGAEIVALSALMTTSMLAMPVVIDKLKARGSTAKIMVGGAPLTPETARRYGADGYADNAASAVREASRLMEEAHPPVYAG
jgi:corrinoid protein of di/trimethylamine methyltransferase